MPYESTRVCLQPIRGVEGSDYINASFIDGYRYPVADGLPLATVGPRSLLGNAGPPQRSQPCLQGASSVS